MTCKCRKKPAVNPATHYRFPLSKGKTPRIFDQTPPLYCEKKRRPVSGNGKAG